MAEEAASATSPSCPGMCKTFHTFCERFAVELYDAHVHLPTRAAQDKAMAEYDKLGCYGAIGSTDVTHIKWDCCPYSEQRSYSGRGRRVTRPSRTRLR